MNLKRNLPLLMLLSILACFCYFHLYRFLNFDSLQTYRFLLLQWKDDNYIFAVCLYISFYCLSVASAFPGVFFLSLAGGFLFGSFPGSLYVLLGATLGSLGLYCALRLALADWFEKKAAKWIKPVKQGLQENAFYYLLMLRIIPVFPFFMINIAAGLLKLPPLTFLTATFIGLIPGTLIYTSLGKNLNALFELGQTPQFSILLQPAFLLPLLALAALAALPVIYKYVKKPAK